MHFVWQVSKTPDRLQQPSYWPARDTNATLLRRCVTRSRFQCISLHWKGKQLLQHILLHVASPAIFIAIANLALYYIVIFTFILLSPKFCSNFLDGIHAWDKSNTQAVYARAGGLGTRQKAVSSLPVVGLIALTTMSPLPCKCARTLLGSEPIFFSVFCLPLANCVYLTVSQL